MTVQRARGGRPSAGSPDKQRAVLAGALAVFARDGFARASMDAIAAQANVSTRTIYNHFTDKEHLFHALIETSATAVADAQIAIIDRYLRKITDLRADLIEFGIAWAAPDPAHADHFALVRHINADIAHIPAEAVDAWQKAGPLRVRRELARHLQPLADRGLLHLADADRAALHLTLLVSVDNPSLPSRRRTRRQTLEMVTAGVDAFLHGYQARLG